MKHKKLMLIAILFVSAILATSAIAGIKDNKVFKYLKGLSDDTTALTAMLILTTILTQYISWYGADLILANPAVAGPNASPAIANAVNSFLYLLIPFYIIAFLITGIYFLFSQSPEGRAKSKSMFFKLIISMGAVFIALPLFQLLLDVSQGIAQSIFSIGGDYVNIWAVFSATSALATTIAALFMPLPSGKLIAFLFLLFIVLTLIVIILILVMRYLLVVLAAIVFPFTLVLWLFEFPYEKELGAKLMHHTIVWIFTPVITATVIVLTSVIAGGFYSQCGSLLSSAVSGIGGGVGYYLGGYGGAALGAGLPLLADSDCWLSFFAGIAATFLILAAPLMMYGLMAWVGAGILFFGWTSMAVPLTTAAGGFGPVGLRYFGFPGADVLLRIPGAEEFLDKFAGLRPLYGKDGRILGMTTAVKGYYAGEMPLGAPLILRGLGGGRGITPSTEVNAALYGRGLREGETSWEARFFAHSKEEGYRFWRPETVIPKLGPLAVVAAGGVLAGMGPLGIVTAGLKGLWYEPGASFPLEGEITLADGSKMLTLAPKSLGREFTPEGLILAKAPNLCRECYPEEYNILVNTPKGHQRLADAMGVGVDKVPGKLAAMNAPEGSPHAPMPPPSTDAGEQLAAEKKRKEAEERIMKEFEKNREMIEKERLLERVKMEKGPEAGKLKGLDEIDKKYDTQLRRAEIGRDKKLLKREPIRRRAEIERQMPEKIAEKEKKGLDEFGSKYPEEADYVKKRKERIDKEVERIRTSYKEHPTAAVERRKAEITAEEISKGTPEKEANAKADIIAAAMIMGVPHWGAFGQSARILSRQAQLMHGLKNFKVYTPTPPKFPDWARRRWESEEQKKRQ